MVLLMIGTGGRGLLLRSQVSATRPRPILSRGDMWLVIYIHGIKMGVMRCGIRLL